MRRVVPSAQPMRFGLQAAASVPSSKFGRGRNPRIIPSGKIEATAGLSLNRHGCKINAMKQEIMRDITVTARGQITLPVAIRKSLRLGTARKLRMRLSADGNVTLRPLPDVMSYYGALKNRIPYDHQERAKAHRAIADRAAKEAR